MKRRALSSRTCERPLASDSALGEPEADQAGRSHDEGAAVSEAVVRGGSSGSLSAESIVGWFVQVGHRQWEERDADGAVIVMHFTSYKRQQSLA